MSDKNAHKLENEEFGKEKEETYSNKRIKEAQIDRLSALPDSLIIHILSLLDLNVKKAAATCVLSKRWQFIWSELPWLYFCNHSCLIEDRRNFVSWVGRTLLLRSSGIHLESFEIDFYYDECFATDFNGWVRFAIRSKVKLLSLVIQSSTHHYKPPQVLYSSSSLRYLNVVHCVLAPGVAIDWPSMTGIWIRNSEVDENLIRKIILGCPELRSLYLAECWGFERLDLDSTSLDMLEISHPNGEEGDMRVFEISAPYLRNLHITFDAMWSKMQLKNVSSLISVSICFTTFEIHVEVLNNAKELFENIRHVKDVKLETLCVKAVSELVFLEHRLPQSRREVLRLVISRDEDCIPGILGLLESSPNLNTLHVEYSQICDKYMEFVARREPADIEDLDSDLLHLKTVRVLNYADPNPGCEPMLTVARILLKRAPALELMVIDAQGKLTDFPSEFAMISQKVLSYPRASEKAVIDLHQ
ncbi:hypothetical protein CASFOL_036634 [Castilleja foliolosa]|uniref:At1g61320/AtMIF1 LRR domain-containing protein n=1 Tax=Castilleja foliolosa TaxID=1961234 RepID=A0ABD3B7A8_9LAMI